MTRAPSSSGLGSCNLRMPVAVTVAHLRVSLTEEAAAPEIRILLRCSSILQCQDSSTGPLQLQQPRQRLSRRNLHCHRSARQLSEVPECWHEHLDECCLRRRDEHVKLWRRRGLDPLQPLHTTAAGRLRRSIRSTGRSDGPAAHPRGKREAGGGNGGGGGGSSQSAVLNKLTGLILSSPFRGSALIVSALNTMRPALISILADVQVDLTINTDCGARHICTQTPSDRRTGYGCPPSLELNNLQFHTHR